MGKLTGFLEYQRLEEAHLAPEQRKKHFREFFLPLTDEQAQKSNSDFEAATS